MHRTLSAPDTEHPTPGGGPAERPIPPGRARTIGVALRVLFFGSTVLAVVMSYVGPVGDLPAGDPVRWAVGLLAAACLVLGLYVPSWGTDEEGES